MAPSDLDDFVGQDHILAANKLLRRMIEADRISSIILFGPPGTGKTSIAKIIAARTNTKYERLNAVTAGVSDIKRIISETGNKIFNPSGRTLLFIDEIHRFNKAQQDALLPHVEDGSLILIGATTQNPYFQVNKALISRSTVFQLHPLTEENVAKILNNALTDDKKGLGNYDIRIDKSVIEYIANVANGDARIALNALELAFMTTSPDSSASITITKDTILECMQKRSLAFDRDEESHYDNISAFIKSMRGSDPDATVFYLARALHGGEDIEFIARRIMICASEDVGMANPAAFNTAVSAFTAVKSIGMPEARIILAHAALIVACSPKSNSAYLAIDRALKDVEDRQTGEVPLHLRNAPVREMKDLGYGKGYKYAHDYPGNYVEQEFLPEKIKGTIYYTPYSNGYEEKIKEWIDKKRKNNELSN
ncbi:MAG: replication-associated recombination protein A [Eubacteriales bacterium]|nr:replication-associated recombination protein A [Eubacteriales bacterium]